jgi:glycosyltransferase involved in cell wall biosynthesis
MKIAIFYHLNFGGAKRVVMDHAKGLKDKGHEVDLYTVNHEKDAFDPSVFCGKTYNYTFVIDSKIPFLKRFINDYKNFFILKNLQKKIAREIDSRKYDIVLVHPDKLTQAPFLLRFLKTPSAYYCQEPLRIVYEYSMRMRDHVGLLKRGYEELTRLYRKRLDRENVRSASLTIASCYYVRERMIESYEVYPKVVYCAVDENTFKPISVKKKNQIFYVGSPGVWEDGYDLVKNALKYIPKKIRPTLHVISWKKSNGERLTEKELVTIYNESLITLCTSRLETFGLVPLESMACGVPVIATNVSGHRETMYDKKTGFLVDFDPEEIAEKIHYLLSNESARAAMQKNARQHILTHWTWQKQINELETVLEKHIS